MQNSVCQQCGGCVFRGINEEQYRNDKITDFQKTIALIKNSTPVFDAPVFIKDGMRRRADMAFRYAKKTLTLGFNEAKSHNLVNIFACPMLDSKMVNNLPQLRSLIEELCTLPITVKTKKKKFETIYIREGTVQLLLADNGMDIMLNLPIEPVLEHRFAIANFVNRENNVCRVSWKIAENEPETIAEKMPPELHIAGNIIEIPQGVFLQASKAAETAMIEIVLRYMGNEKGKIADLFCGLGTFTIPLAQIPGSNIIAADSSTPALNGLQKALNRNQIHNVMVVNRNLFKYPFDAADLKGLKALVLDPPRAGAHAQCREIANLSPVDKPQKIVFVSCNPKTFVYDAETLINAGYIFERVTLVDQFVYSKHQELVALFTYNHKTEKGA